MRQVGSSKVAKSKDKDMVVDRKKFHRNMSLVRVEPLSPEEE